MPKAIIGEPYVFTALFLDATNTPVAVTSPTIEVLTFDDGGIKVPLVAAGTAMVIVPSEVGRYQYTYTVPDTLTRAQTLHAVMQGLDGVNVLLVEETVDLFTEDEAGPGLVARFVQGG